MIATRAPGVINASASYTVAEFRRRAGLARYAFTQARGRGLRVIAVGRKRFVLGADWLRFLEREAENQSA